MCRYRNDFLGRVDSGPPELPNVAGFSYFCKVWKESRKHIVTRKYIPFAKCDFCTNNRAAASTTRDQNTRNQLRKSLRGHLKEIAAERATYHRNGSRAVNQPEDYLSLIIDGADQGDYGLPHCVDKSHVSEKGYKIHMKVMGVIAHGRGSWAFTCPPHIAQGNNVTIQALWYVLLDIKRREGTLPLVLNLQLDNTSKQCKGRSAPHPHPSPSLRKNITYAS